VPASTVAHSWCSRILAGVCRIGRGTSFNGATTRPRPHKRRAGRDSRRIVGPRVCRLQNRAGVGLTLFPISSVGLGFRARSTSTRERRTTHKRTDYGPLSRCRTLDTTCRFAGSTSGLVTIGRTVSGRVTDTFTISRRPRSQADRGKSPCSASPRRSLLAVEGAGLHVSDRTGPDGRRDPFGKIAARRVTGRSG